MAEVMTQGEHADEEILNVDMLLSGDPFLEVDEKEILNIVKQWATINKETLAADKCKVKQKQIREQVGDALNGYATDDESDMPYTSEDDMSLNKGSSNATISVPNMIEVSIEPFDESSSSLDDFLDEQIDSDNCISIEFQGKNATPCTKAKVRAAQGEYKDAKTVFTFGKLIQKNTKAPQRRVAQQHLQATTIPKQKTARGSEATKSKQSTTSTRPATTVHSRNIKPPIASTISLNATYIVKPTQASHPRNIFKATTKTSLAAGAGATANALRSQGTSLELRRARNTTQQQTAKHVERLSMKKPSQVPTSIYQRSNTFTIESAQIKKEQQQQKRKDDAEVALATARRGFKRPTQIMDKIAELPRICFKDRLPLPDLNFNYSRSFNC